MAYRSAQTIDDLLADSLIQKVMLADHVEPQALKTLLDGTARRIAEFAASRPPCRSGRISAGAARFADRSLLTRPTTRTSGGECGASLCG